MLNEPVQVMPADVPDAYCPVRPVEHVALRPDVTVGAADQVSMGDHKKSYR